MLAKMIDKIVSLKETKIFEINGQTYADASLTRIPPHVDRPDCISVSGLDSICKLIRTELEKVGTTIMVQVKSNDTVEVMTTYLSDFSRNTLYRAKADAPGLYTGFRGREVALIELRSLCIPNEGTAYLLDLLSRMTNENSVSTNDNGVTQTVEARQGVALNAVVEIKPRVMLRPFRTFLEVEQPESEFLLRVDPDEGIGFCGLLAVAFIVLKLTGVINWSWLWVLAPIWIPTAITLAIIVIVLVAILVRELTKGGRP